MPRGQSPLDVFRVRRSRSVQLFASTATFKTAATEVALAAELVAASNGHIIEAGDRSKCRIENPNVCTATAQLDFHLDAGCVWGFKLNCIDPSAATRHLNSGATTSDKKTSSTTGYLHTGPAAGDLHSSSTSSDLDACAAASNLNSSTAASHLDTGATASNLDTGATPCHLKTGTSTCNFDAGAAARDVERVDRSVSAKFE